MKRQLKALKKPLFLLSPFILACTFTESHAAFRLPDFDTLWNPVIALEVGAAHAIQPGSAHFFPASPPLNFQFFNYGANHATRNRGLIGLFIGIDYSHLYSYDNDYRFQLGLEMNQLSIYSVDGQLTQGVDSASTSTFNYHYHIRARQYLIEGKFLTRIKRYFYPYVLAGFGLSYTYADHFETNVPPLLTFTRHFNSKSLDSFSYALGFGVDIEVKKPFSLGIGYRFADYGPVQLGSSTIDTIPVQGTMKQNHFQVHELIMQLSYVRF